MWLLHAQKAAAIFLAGSLSRRGSSPLAFSDSEGAKAISPSLDCQVLQGVASGLGSARVKSPWMTRRRFLCTWCSLRPGESTEAGLSVPAWQCRQPVSVKCEREPWSGQASPTSTRTTFPQPHATLSQSVSWNLIRGSGVPVYAHEGLHGTRA